MIIEEKELYELGKKVVMVDGCFDPLHIGHIEYFKQAAALGYPVLCNAQDDDYINRVKGRNVLLSEDQRIRLLNELRSISYVFLCRSSTADVLEKLRPAKYIKGNDWKDAVLPEKEREICSRYGIDIEFLDTKLDSSRSIAMNYSVNSERTNFEAVAAVFEEIVLSQKAVGSESYDDGYFNEAWRTAGNVYTIEKRREIEARNPDNIKDVFNPESVLDVGCGMGALMLFLQELGINVHGIDFSQAAKNMAVPAVREQIIIGDVTEYHDLGKNFDLVICREVIEHLTVLQIRKFIKVLARYTSKYLYITTRYFQDPKTFLDVGDDLQTDPTHITVMNKEFLRALFVMEGLRSRRDLERKMDWKNVGRVLVFEKVNK